MMKGLYVLVTLGMGTVITVVVSLACSYWFFSSLMGGSGYQAIGAGVAGCAIQLFGYGFSASFLRLHALLRWVLCLVPLALSMFCTYSALYGYLSAEKQEKSLAGKKQELILGILEQSAKDREVLTAAAKQSVSERYRTQAKAYLQSNEAARDKDEKLIEKLESSATASGHVTPLDGLVRVTGNSELVTIVFCAWLAVLFDILPVIAIAVITRRRAINHDMEKDVEIPKTAAPIEIGDHINNVIAPLIVVETMENTSQPASAQNQPQQAVSPVHLEVKSTIETYQEGAVQPPAPETEILKPIEATEEDKIQVFTKTRDGSSLDVQSSNKSYEDIIVLLRNGTLKPNYKSVQEYTSWSQWKSQEFFKDCQEKGILEKDGRSFKILTNVAMLDSVKNVVNA